MSPAKKAPVKSIAAKSAETKRGPAKTDVVRQIFVKPGSTDLYLEVLKAVEEFKVAVNKQEPEAGKVATAPEVVHEVPDGHRLIPLDDLPLEIRVFLGDCLQDSTERQAAAPRSIENILSPDANARLMRLLDALRGGGSDIETGYEVKQPRKIKKFI